MDITKNRKKKVYVKDAGMTFNNDKNEDITVNIKRATEMGVISTLQSIKVKKKKVDGASKKFEGNLSIINYLVLFLI